MGPSNRTQVSSKHDNRLLSRSTAPVMVELVERPPTQKQRSQRAEWHVEDKHFKYNMKFCTSDSDGCIGRCVSSSALAEPAGQPAGRLCYRPSNLELNLGDAMESIPNRRFNPRRSATQSQGVLGSLKLCQQTILWHLV